VADVDVSVIIIEELPVPGFSGTRLELRGGGLPKQGATWNGKHQVVTRYYVGNPVATQQSLGPREAPSTWEGAWHRNMLESSPAVWIDTDGVRQEVVHPHLLMTILDDIRFRGYGLRVTWSTKATAEGADIQIIREGRLTDVSFPVTRAEDIDWKATFDWKSRGQNAALVTNLRNPETADLVASLQLQVNAVIVATQALKNKLDPNELGSVSSFSLDQLFKLATYPQSLVDSLTNQLNVVLVNLQSLSDLVTQGAVTPAETADKMLTIARSALAVCNQTVYNFETIPLEYNTVAGSDLADVARNAKYLAGITDSINTTNDSIFAIIEAAKQAKASQSPIDSSGAVVSDASSSAAQNQLYKVKFGDTALSISAAFYGSSDYAGSILKANRLSPYTVDLAVGSILVIPANPQNIFTT
jgi:hypothetical protein